MVTAKSHTEPSHFFSMYVHAPTFVHYLLRHQVRGEYLTVVEGDDVPAKYSVRPTVPVLCDVGHETDGACSCDLKIEMYQQTVPDDTAAVCQNDAARDVPQVVTRRDLEVTRCAVSIPEVYQMLNLNFVAYLKTF